MDHENHWVYVFGHQGGGGPVKVGISKDTNLRLSAIQTSCPYRIESAYIFECANKKIARNIERSFHDTHQAKRAYGEWFNFGAVEAIRLLCIEFRAVLDDDALDPCGVYLAEKRFNFSSVSEEA